MWWTSNGWIWIWPFLWLGGTFTIGCTFLGRFGTTPTHPTNGSSLRLVSIPQGDESVGCARYHLVGDTGSWKYGTLFERPLCYWQICRNVACLQFFSERRFQVSWNWPLHDDNIFCLRLKLLVFFFHRGRSTCMPTTSCLIEAQSKKINKSWDFSCHFLSVIPWKFQNSHRLGHLRRDDWHPGWLVYPTHNS